MSTRKCSIPRPQAQSSARSEAKTYFETQQTARYTIRLTGRAGTFHVRLRHLRARSCQPDALRRPNLIYAGAKYIGETWIMTVAFWLRLVGGRHGRAWVADAAAAGSL